MGKPNRAAALLAPLLLVAAAAGPAAAGDEPAGTAVEEGVPTPPGRAVGLEHPAVESLGERLLEVRGGVEIGGRAVDGKEGRYRQDLNLDGGFRLLSAEWEATSLVEGLAVDLLSMRLRGVGDPMQSFDFRASARETYDLRILADREETIHRTAGDPHLFDTRRGRVGGRLSFRPAEDLEVRLSSDRFLRSGDGFLDQYFLVAGRALPVAASLDYERRADSAGFDATSGAFRFGGTATWSRTEDDALRTFDRPDLPDDDAGVHRSVSRGRSRSAVGRAGLRLGGGTVDLSVQGSYHASETDSRILEAAVVSDGGANSWTWEQTGSAEANSRGWWWRGEALVAPARDFEVLGRYEQRTGAVNGDADLLTRVQTPPGSAPGDPFFADAYDTRNSAHLRRAGAEGRWRASAAWRLRGGVEQVAERMVAERIRAEDEDPDTWRPTTLAGTAGVDFRPSARFDASLLARLARARDPATALSADEGRALSLRIRAKRPDGWRATGHARVKQRTGEEADSLVSFDSYGVTLGRDAGFGFFELSATRESFAVESDTDVVTSLAPFARGPWRARYDETVTAAALDLSVVLSGPLRLFGSGRFARADGDLPYDQVDASAGIGWRFVPSTELRAEARRVSYEEDERTLDDYTARIFTLSLLWEF